MMTALDESVHTQRQLISDASHELRAPLTSLTTNLELLADGRGLRDPDAPTLVREAIDQADELRSTLPVARTETVSRASIRCGGDTSRSV